MSRRDVPSFTSTWIAFMPPSRYATDLRCAANQWAWVAHAIGVNSGTSALHLALIVAGIGPGDEVLLPSHTFIATAWAVLYVGATPVLCDVEAESGTIDVADAERRLSSATKAIIPRSDVGLWLICELNSRLMVPPMPFSSSSNRSLSLVSRYQP